MLPLKNCLRRHIKLYHFTTQIPSGLIYSRLIKQSTSTLSYLRKQTVAYEDYFLQVFLVRPHRIYIYTHKIFTLLLYLCAGNQTSPNSPLSPTHYIPPVTNNRKLILTQSYLSACHVFKTYTLK